MVRILPPLNFSLEHILKRDEHLLSACDSPLAHHVGSVSLGSTRRGAVTAERLAIASMFLPNLRTMKVHLDSSSLPARFPQQLTSLEVSLEAEPHWSWSSNNISADQAIAAIGLSQHLQSLRLLAAGHGALALNPLVSIGALRSLDIQNVDLSQSQAKQLREMKQLRHLAAKVQASRISELFARPHHWSLLRLDLVDDDDEARGDADSVAHLPSLTELALVRLSTSHVDFLCHLPELTAVTFDFEARTAVDHDRVVTALRSCAKLKLLVIGDVDSEPLLFSSEQLFSFLCCMPELRVLFISRTVRLHDLSFLRAIVNLRVLELRDCGKQVPLEEMQQIHALRSLHHLGLSSSTFTHPMDALSQKLHSPPSPLMPALRYFDYSL